MSSTNNSEIDIQKTNSVPSSPNNAKPLVRRSFSMSKLIKAHNKYESEIDDLEKKIVDFIDFEFAIFYQYSDGFVLVHTENSHNAPLGKCIRVIKEKGFLSYDDYIKLCI